MFLANLKFFLRTWLFESSSISLFSSLLSIIYFFPHEYFYQKFRNQRKIHNNSPVYAITSLKILQHNFVKSKPLSLKYFHSFLYSNFKLGTHPIYNSFLSVFLVPKSTRFFYYRLYHKELDSSLFLIDILLLSYKDALAA